jgi:hypothetical protein
MGGERVGSEGGIALKRWALGRVVGAGALRSALMTEGCVHTPMICVCTSNSSAAFRSLSLVAVLASIHSATGRA